LAALRAHDCAGGIMHAQSSPRDAGPSVILLVSLDRSGDSPRLIVHGRPAARLIALRQNAHVRENVAPSLFVEGVLILRRDRFVDVSRVDRNSHAEYLRLRM
jgi:hypothetical protein